MVTEYEQRIIDSVAEHGWFCVSVGAGEGTPSFSYSVGFWETLNAPELIVFGLPHKLMHSMLWAAFRQIKSGKARVAEGAKWSNILEGFDCVLRLVHRTQIRREFFNSAMWYRRHCSGDHAEVDAYQLFWPGKPDGLFPWDRDCAGIVIESQPQLYLPRQAGLA